MAVVCTWHDCLMGSRVWYQLVCSQTLLWLMNVLYIAGLHFEACSSCNQYCDTLAVQHLSYDATFVQQVQSCFAHRIALHIASSALARKTCPDAKDMYLIHKGCIITAAHRANHVDIGVIRVHVNVWHHKVEWRAHSQHIIQVCEVALQV